MRTFYAMLAISATAVGLSAQQTVTITAGQKGQDEGVMIAQGAAGVMGLSGAPGSFRYFTQEFSINGRTVTGAPYTADEKTESVQTLADGTHIANTTTTRVYRDSQGRTRTEMALPSLPGETTPHVMITISDPVAGVNYTLDSENKVAHKMPAPMVGHIRAAERLPDAMPKMANSTGFIYREARMQETKHEDLGASEMEGVAVTGSRDTSTIEIGAMGNDRPITITSERWYSPDLQIEVKSIHNDPRTGQTTHAVTNITRSEPDATLFQVPSDYKVDEPNVHIERFESHQ